MRHLAILVLLLCGFTSFGQKKLSQLPQAPGVDTGSYMVGVENTSGTYSDYRFSIAQLAAYIGGSSSNFGNADLPWTGNRSHNAKGYYTTIDSMGRLVFKDIYGTAYFAANDGTFLANAVVYMDRSSGALRFHPFSSTTFMTFTNTSTGNLFTYSSWGKTHIAVDSATNKFSLENFSGGKYAVSIDATTGRVTIDSAYGLPLLDGSSGMVPVTNGARILSFAYVSKLGLVGTYNGTATAGNGVWAIRGHATYKNRSTSITVTTFSVPADQEFVLTGYLNPSSMSGSVDYFVDFTDQNGNAVTHKIGSTGSTGMTDVYSPEIQAKASTTITLYTTLTGTGTYDVSGTITQVN